MDEACSVCGATVDAEDCAGFISNYSTMQYHPLCDLCDDVRNKIFQAEKREFVEHFDRNILERLRDYADQIGDDAAVIPTDEYVERMMIKWAGK